MWVPKKTKYRKLMKGRISGCTNSSVLHPSLRHGGVRIITTEPGYLQVCQLESARRVLVTNTKRYAKIWPIVFPDISRSAKPKESRMGHGKGAFSYWVSRVSAGSSVFEFTGLQLKQINNLDVVAGKKLPTKFRLVRYWAGL